MFRFLTVSFVTLSLISFSRSLFAEVPAIEHILPHNTMVWGSVRSIKVLQSQPEIKRMIINESIKGDGRTIPSFFPPKHIRHRISSDITIINYRILIIFKYYIKNQF